MSGSSSPRPNAWLADLAKPSTLLVVFGACVGAISWIAGQTAKVEQIARETALDAARLSGQMVEVRALIQVASAENVEQRVAIARLVDAQAYHAQRAEQQIDRVVRVTERQSQDISRLSAEITRMLSGFRPDGLRQDGGRQDGYRPETPRPQNDDSTIIAPDFETREASLR